jgi:nucleoside phosphorylase
MKVDAVILAALPKERSAVLDLLGEAAGMPTKYRSDGRDYEIFHMGRIKVAVPQPMGMGVTYAALATADVLSDLSTKVIVMSGIAGCMGDRPSAGKPARFMLGDIVVGKDLVLNYFPISCRLG